MRWNNLRLRYRLMLAFSSFCLLITILFSLYALAFAYTVEDEFFEAMLKQEVARLQTEFAATGRWADVSDRTLSIVENPAQFPADVRDQFSQHPKRREFAGDQGRHYHLAPLTGDLSGAWLVAQVQDKLVFRQMRSSVFEILFVSTLIILTLALWLAWWLAGSTARPLTELSDVIANWRPNQLAQDLPNMERTDEVGVLARGLRDLVRRIHDFIEREQAFTRDASHELRTPLTVVRCAADQIAAMQDLPTLAKTQLQLIQSSAASLQQTVTTLLEIAREQTQPTSAVRVLPMLEQIIVEQSPWLDQKAMRLRLDVDPQCTITVAESVLHIVLSNLLGNAFQHGRADRLVEIYLAAGRLWIVNEHSPCELSTAQLSVQSGYGFGLVIVKRIGERFGLDITIAQQQQRTLASMAIG